MSLANRNPFARRTLAVLVAGAVATALVTVLVAVGASASHVEVTDPDDTRGPLDMKVVRNEGSLTPRWKVITFGSWTTREIWDYGFVTINIDTIGSPRADYYIVVGSLGSRLFGELWRDRVSKRDYRVSGVRVWRADRSSVTAKIPLDAMDIGGQRLTYSWYAQSMFTGERCRRVCFDFVPDQGVIEEPLPVVAPTPTPTPSVTPSSSPSSSPSPSPSKSHKP